MLRLVKGYYFRRCLLLFNRQTPARALLPLAHIGEANKGALTAKKNGGQLRPPHYLSAITNKLPKLYFFVFFACFLEKKFLYVCIQPNYRRKKHGKTKKKPR